MPLVEIHTQPDCQWGIWRIEEAWPELLRGLERREAHRPFLDGIRADGRRTEWLAAVSYTHLTLPTKLEV